MELKEFIKSAITDIVEALDEAQDAIGDKATIMPYTKRQGGINEIVVSAKPTDIDFDVAVISSEEENRMTKGRGGISVASIAGLSIGKTAETGNSLNQTSRIKFSVQVILPHHHYPAK